VVQPFFLEDGARLLGNLPGDHLNPGGPAQEELIGK
jgi:hypothetical protein